MLSRTANGKHKPVLVSDSCSQWSQRPFRAYPGIDAAAYGEGPVLALEMHSISDKTVQVLVPASICSAPALAMVVARCHPLLRAAAAVAEVQETYIVGW